MTISTKLHRDFRQLARLRTFFGAGNPQEAIAASRKMANRWIKQHSGNVPETVKSQQLHEWFAQSFTPLSPCEDQLLIYVHGGGLVYYDTDVFAPFLGQLAERLNRKVIAFDYKKAPETPALTAFSDLLDRVKAVLKAHPETQISIAGDSVGGLLALYLCQAMPKTTFSSLNLIYPVVDRKITANDPHAKGQFLDETMMNWFYVFIEPLFANHGVPVRFTDDQLGQLPKTTVHIAGCDILAPQAQAFAAKLIKNDAVHQSISHPTLPHDFYLYSGASICARSAISQLVERMKENVDA